MYLDRRIDRLERDGTPDDTGYRHCELCASGENRSIVIRMDGKPDGPLPTCPVCGRETAMVINIMRAECAPRAKGPTA